MNDAVLSSRLLHRGWMDFMLLQVRIAGAEMERSLVGHPSGASVLAYDPGRRVALVARQHRDAVLFLSCPQMPEALGGVTDEGEDAAATARREALEEAGVRLDEVELVARIWMTPSSSTERVSLFLAAYRPSDRVAAGGGLAEEAEAIDVREEPLAALWRMAEGGAMQDAKLFMLLQALRLRRPGLFD